MLKYFIISVLQVWQWTEAQYGVFDVSGVCVYDSSSKVIQINIIQYDLYKIPATYYFAPFAAPEWLW